MRVFSNTAISLDGRIGTTARDHVQVGSDEDRQRMSHLRAQADAVLVGGQTFRSWPHPMVENLEDSRPRSQPLINAVLTRKGLGVHCADEWRQVELLVLAGQQAGLDGLADGPATILRHSDPSPIWALDVLEDRGCSAVLVEGGGDLIFQLLAADRLDELYVTVCPKLIGGTGAPSLVDGLGFDAGAIRDLDLQGLERAGSELFLHYRVRR